MSAATPANAPRVIRPTMASAVADAVAASGRSAVPPRRPLQPTTHELQENGRAFPPNYLHQSWRDFLYWDTELDPF